MITEIKNPELKLSIPKFLCDTDCVGEHLLGHSLTSLLNVYGFLCVIGRPGSGKTSLAISLITQKDPKVYRKTHHHVLIMMPQHSINSLKTNPFKVLPDENIYNELTDETISDVYNKIKKFSEDDEKTLLFVDDMTADLKKTKLIIHMFKRLVYNRRHLKLNIIITAQSFVNLPLDIRKNIQNLILFKPPKKELEIIFDELIESKKNMFLEIMKITYDTIPLVVGGKGGDPPSGKHNFLFLNVPSQRIFKNWNELVITEEGDAPSYS